MGLEKQGLKRRGSKDFYPHFSACRRGDLFGGEFERKLSEAFFAEFLRSPPKEAARRGPEGRAETGPVSFAYFSLSA